MSLPNIKDFVAYENHQPPEPVNLYVLGKVETNNGALRPKLRMADPQGINENILILNLTIEQTQDVGTKDIAFRDVRYDHEGDRAQYEAVDIHWDGESLISLTPEVIT